ncbi:MAG: zinc transporter ZupT [Bacteroidales bacterium]|jgi:ZIP family zinc transporter|nr:zinc transporter ZupT [Bacteroidales bacterium]
MEKSILLPLLLTLLAGLATSIGSLIAFFAKKTNRKFLSFSLGFSAGVMIYISFVELFPQAKLILSNSFGEKLGFGLTSLWFFIGIFFIGIIDRLVPSAENPHQIRSVENLNSKSTKDNKLMRVGIITALVIGIHNFPEGIATFISTMDNPTLGFAIAFAIAIHNIPEGIAVSIPIYQATGSKKKAFWLSFFSGLAEPIGAILAYLVLMPFLSQQLLGYVFAFVGGIMVFISLDELLPAAREYGESHISIYGLVIGMIVMATSLIVL